jgi:hypothetical protein
VGPEDVGGVQDHRVEAPLAPALHLELGEPLAPEVIDGRVECGGLHLLADAAGLEAVGGDAGGVNETPGLAAEYRRYDVTRSLHVDLGLPGVARLPVARVTGQMEDGVHARRHGALARGWVGDVPLHERDAPLLQGHGVRCGAVEDDHLPASG